MKKLLQILCAAIHCIQDLENNNINLMKSGYEVLTVLTFLLSNNVDTKVLLILNNNILLLGSMEERGTTAAILI